MNIDKADTYISPNKITQKYDITSGTLRRWAESGKIRCIRPNGGKRLYSITDVKALFEEKVCENTNEKTNDVLNLDLKNAFRNLKMVVKKQIQNDTLKFDAISPFEEKEFEFIIANIKKN